MSGNSQQGIVFLRGKRVVLRPPLREDIPLLLRWVNDSEIRRNTSSYLPVLESFEEDWLEGLSKKRDSDIVFMIVVGGRAIGVMGIHQIDWRHRCATTGTVIGEKEFRSQGIGTEAKMLLLNYAFNTLNLRRMRSQAYSFNKASIAYSKKCGYKEEGRLRQHSFVDGEYVDDILLAVLRDEWLSVWEEFEREHLSS